MLFAAMFSGVFAQPITNGGFENWASPAAPDGWSSFGSATGFFTSLVKKDTVTGNHNEGSASVQVMTDSATVPGAGFLTIPGTLIYGPSTYKQGGLVSPGAPMTKRIDTLFFSYKYTPAAGKPDTAYMALVLTKWKGTKRDTLLEVGTLLEPQATIQPIYFELTPYYNASVTGNPDTLHMVFFSSSDSAYQGSKLWVDRIRFNKAAESTSNVGIHEAQEMGAVKVFPTPARDVVNFEISEEWLGATLEVTNAAGSLVRRETLNELRSTFNINDWNNGVYQYVLRRGDQVRSGSISVLK